MLQYERKRAVCSLQMISKLTSPSINYRLQNNVDKAALESVTEMSDFGLNEFSAWTQTGKSALPQMILVHFKLVICLHVN